MNVKELRIEMLKHDDSGGDLAKFLGISKTTLSKRFNNKGNSDFSRVEIMSIKDRYNLSPERVDEIFFGEEVS